MDAIVSAVPVWGLVALGVLAVLQIALDVFALVDLYRRPIDQVVFANKWIWLAIVLLVSTVGAIIYLVVARKPAVGPDDAPPPASKSARTDTIADTLYGPRDGTDQPTDHDVGPREETTRGRRPPIRSLTTPTLYGPPRRSQG